MTFGGPHLAIRVILSSLLGVQKALWYNENERTVDTGAENSDVLSKLLRKYTCREYCPVQSVKSNTSAACHMCAPDKGLSKETQEWPHLFFTQDRGEHSLLSFRVKITHHLPAPPIICRDRMESLTQVKGRLDHPTVMDSSGRQWLSTFSRRLVQDCS